LISALAIWIVSKLGLGLEVTGFGSAFIAAIFIAFVAGTITLLLGLAGIGDSMGLTGGLIHLVITAIALLIGDRLLPGLKVAGITGALLAGVAIGAIYWLGGLLLAQII
jgi:uncharacterized membrane protein YvlD (DUF360 family)